MGFAAIYVSEENGGCGLGRLEASLIFEALATGKFVFSLLTFHFNRMRGIISVYLDSQHVCVDD